MTIAPSFDALDQNGIRHRLADYRGRWLALYFYPRDDTPHCTQQACSVRDHREALAEHGIAVLGVSAQDGTAHRAFAAKHRLNFPLLVDAGQTLGRAYGALGDGVGGWLRSRLGAYRRITVLISPDGRIAKVIDTPDVQDHAGEILRSVAAGQAATLPGEALSS